MSRLRTFLNISVSLSYTHTFIYIFHSPSLSLSLIHRSCLFNGYKILSPSSLRISIYSIPLSFYSLLISLLLPLGIHSALSFLMSFFSSNILKYVFPLSFSFISFHNDFFSLSSILSSFLCHHFRIRITSVHKRSGARIKTLQNLFGSSFHLSTIRMCGREKNRCRYQ
jgi:hypothetical protein